MTPPRSLEQPESDEMIVAITWEYARELAYIIQEATPKIDALAIARKRLNDGDRDISLCGAAFAGNMLDRIRLWKLLCQRYRGQFNKILGHPKANETSQKDLEQIFFESVRTTCIDAVTTGAGNFPLKGWDAIALGTVKKLKKSPANRSYDHFAVKAAFPQAKKSGLTWNPFEVREHPIVTARKNGLILPAGTAGNPFDCAMVSCPPLELDYETLHEFKIDWRNSDDTLCELFAEWLTSNNRPDKYPIAKAGTKQPLDFNSFRKQLNALRIDRGSLESKQSNAWKKSDYQSEKSFEKAARQAKQRLRRALL